MTPPLSFTVECAPDLVWNTSYSPAWVQPAYEAPLFAAVTTVALAYFVAGVAAFLLLKSRDERLYKRHSTTVVVASLATPFSVATVSLREALGRENFPCAIFWWGGMLSLACAVSPFFAETTYFYASHVLRLRVVRAMQERRARGRGGDSAFATGPAVPRRVAQSPQPQRAAVPGDAQPRLTDGTDDDALTEAPPARGVSFRELLWYMFRNVDFLFRTPDTATTWRGTRARSSATSSAAGSDLAQHANALATVQDLEIVSSFRFYATLLTLVFLTFVVAAGIVTATTPRYTHYPPCVGCELSNTDVYSFAGLLATWGLVQSRVLWMLSRYPDPLGVHRSLLLGGASGAVTVVLGLMLSALDPGDLETERRWHWGALQILACTLLEWFLAVDPLLAVFAPQLRGPCSGRGASRTESDGESAASSTDAETKAGRERSRALDGVLADPVARGAFELWLVHELGREALFCVDAVRSFVAGYDSCSNEMRQKRARVLYNTYLAEDAPFLVNVPGTVFDDVRRAMAASSREKPVPRGAFDAAHDELCTLLTRGALARYLADRRSRESGDGRDAWKWACSLRGARVWG